MSDLRFYWNMFLAEYNTFWYYIYGIASYLALPIELILLISRGAGVAALQEIALSDILLWIPVVVFSLAMPLAFLHFVLSRMILSYIDFEEKRNEQIHNAE